MQITLHQQNQPPLILHCHQEQTLAQAIWLSGKLPPRPLCSGLGSCALCKVRFMHAAPEALEIEKTLLSAQHITEGWRLACRHTMKSLASTIGTNIDLSLFNTQTPHENSNVAHTTLNLKKAECSHGSTFLAVDLGTTSLCWKALHHSHTDQQIHTIAEGKCLNPQMGAGSDIISRLQMAMHKEGIKTLSGLVRKQLQQICQNLPPINQICLAANTAMTAIFLEKDCTGLAHAPYSLPMAGNATYTIADLAPIYIPPQLAPFVGGDISAGYAALLQEKNVAYPFLLADLGTNGEFILAIDEHTSFITSVPMGPALEGIGLTFGQMVHNFTESIPDDFSDNTQGIVHKVSLNPQGLQAHTINNKAPGRLCGTGYLSLIHALVRSHCIAVEGYFTPQSTTAPLFKKIAAHFNSHNNETIFNLWPHDDTKNIYLRATDVEEILKVKAAFSLAVQELLKTAHMRPADLQKIYISGAMGTHVQPTDLEGLGFIPEGIGKKITALGNTSLEGACILLIKPQEKARLQSFAKHCTHVELVQDSLFTEKFMRHMQFSYPN